MSIVSNHQPEVVDAMNAAEEAPEQVPKLRIYKPPSPVHGHCRMVLWSPDTESVIEINDAPYWLKLLWDSGNLVGVRLEKMGTPEVYDIALNESHGPRCDCPDMTYRPNRPGGCKHVKAVQRLLKAKGEL